MPLPESFVAEVIEHMNTDHADSLRDYAMVYGNLASVRAVVLSDISNSTMTLLCDLGHEHQTLTIPLVTEIRRPEQMRGVLVSMAKKARQQLAPKSDDS